MAIADRLAGQPRLAQQACKELALRAHDMDRNTGLRMEQLALRMLQDTADVSAVAAYFNHRNTSG